MASMRTPIEIVGLGNRMKGVSEKTKKPYDFQTVSFLFPDKFTTGMNAGTNTLDGSVLDAIPGGLTIGNTYDAVIETGRNNFVKIHAIL